MRTKKRTWGAWLLILIGIVLSTLSLGMLLSIQDRLEYAVVAPNGDKAADEIEALAEAKDTLSDTLADCTSAITIGGGSETVSVSYGENSASATMYAIGEGWFEVYPVSIASGRILMESELKNGSDVALMDADLAFSLFGEELPEDASAQIGGVKYRIAGTVRHRGSVGDINEYCVYVPLSSALTIGMDTMMVSALPVPDTGARILFESTVKSSWKDGGSFYSIEKEVMRKTILPRLLLLVFGLRFIFVLIHRMNGIMRMKIDQFREKLRCC